MAKVTRKFCSVGNGLFSIETVQFAEADKITMVYDCGFQHTSEIETAIHNEFSEGDVIDCLFLSHLHNDHINGVDELLRHCHVKHIFLPELSPEYVCALACKDPKSISTIHAIVKTNPAGEPYIHCVSPYYIDSEININNSVNAETINISSIGDKCQSISTFINDKDCVYHTFCINNLTQQQREDFLNKFGFKANEAFCNIAKIWHKQQTEIADYFKNTLKFRSHDYNINSLIVISEACAHKNCCLYTGDYKARGKRLELMKQHFAKEWDDIKILLVPHHGSIYNFSTKLLSPHKLCYTVISAASPICPQRKIVNPTKVINKIRVYCINKNKYINQLDTMNAPVTLSYTTP